MTEVERAQEALCELAAAFTKAAAAIADMFREIVKGSFKTGDPVELVAYAMASQERPEWVHKVNYSKKKRTRKKYHDRIVRTYGSR